MSTSTTSQLSGRIIQTQATATAATFGILESFLAIIPKGMLTFYKRPCLIQKCANLTRQGLYSPAITATYNHCNNVSPPFPSKTSSILVKIQGKYWNNRNNTCPFNIFPKVIEAIPRRLHYWLIVIELPTAKPPQLL